MAVGIVGSGQAIAGAMWPAIFQSGISDYGWRDTALGYGVLSSRPWSHELCVPS